MSEVKKKLFGLFQSRTSSEKSPKHSKNGKDRSHRRRRRSAHSPTSSDRVDSPRAEPRKSTGSHVSNLTTPPLTEWPPAGLPPDGEMSQGKAMELIATGIPVFKGHLRAIPHASDDYYALYATCERNGTAGTDRGEPYNAEFAVASFRIQGTGSAVYPWETLEQPSLAFCHGTGPGTVTLNHWVSLSGNSGPSINLRNPDPKPRKVGLSTILERLRFLEAGFEEDYEELMYNNLYKNLLEDPDKFLNPHKATEKQIADLITVLSRHEWVDFSKPENQVVAKFFANATYTDHGRYKAFFHQLLLSMELDLRINSGHHADWAKETILSQLPPCIAYDLALARRWRECMTIEKFKTGGDPEQIRFHLRAKKAQVKSLRKFARVMKWPNLAKVDAVLKEGDPDTKPLENRSSDTMSYFTGMILPGITLPWLIINSLIDCDDDAASLAALTHMFPNSGFQYRSTTYWSSNSIVGKVLAPTCQEIAGWIGPARPAPDLSRVQIARIRQRQPKQRLRISDVESMTIRSDALGPPSTTYPVSEYKLPLPDTEFIIDTIRIEKLALKPVSSPPNPEGKDKPLTYDAAVQFAIGGHSWPLRLSYDVSFIAAYPCSRGPHPLFFDYVHKVVKVDEILTIKDWGGMVQSGSIGAASTKSGRESGPALTVEDEDYEKEKVLVVEAFGVSDNEVLCRAWCSHWGLSAVVADVERACMACAIREAYAACLTVVILVDATACDDE